MASVDIDRARKQSLETQIVCGYDWPTLGGPYTIKKPKLNSMWKKKKKNGN